MMIADNDPFYLPNIPRNGGKNKRRSSFAGAEKMVNCIQAAWKPGIPEFAPAFLPLQS